MAALLLWRSSLAEWPLQGLVGVGVGRGLERLRPLRLRAATLRRRPWPAVPADLLHGVIELDHMAVGTDRVCGVIDAGMKVERDGVDETQSFLLEKGDRVAQLRVGRDRHA